MPFASGRAAEAPNQGLFMFPPTWWFVARVDSKPRLWSFRVARIYGDDDGPAAFE